MLVNPRVLDREGWKQKAPFRAGYRDRPAIIAGAHVILTNPVRTETQLCLPLAACFAMSRSDENR